MLKIIIFLSLFLLHANVDCKNLPHLRHSRMPNPFPLHEYRGEQSKYNEDKFLATTDDFKLSERSKLSEEELTTPTYETEIISYADDTKNYKVELPLPQKSKDGQAANLFCHVPTRRGMIITHCGLADDEGSCPATKSCGFVIPHFWTLPKLCLSDFDCPFEQKCCRHSCYQHKICQHHVPENAQATVNHINIRQFINLNVNKETPENIGTILNATLNVTNMEKAFWNLTNSNSSDYNLTVSYTHDNFSHKPINSNNEDGQFVFSNISREESLPLDLTITNRIKEYEPASDLPDTDSSTTDSSKEYTPTSNSTLNNSQQHELHVVHILPKSNPLDPDAEFDESEGLSGSGSGDDGFN